MIVGPPTLPAPGTLISVTDEIVQETLQGLQADQQPRLQDGVLQRVAAAVSADTTQSARLLHALLESD
jgi:hypothetical protein